jgi:hypothetical protein
MPSYYRDGTGPEPNRSRLVGVVAIECPDGAIHRALSVSFGVVPRPGTVPRRSDESHEPRPFARDDIAEVTLWPAATPVRDANFAFAGTPVVA